ncbi:MAG TPA: AMP-binding protein, partial [Spirochaetia bacterium]|nr:AMP-binding protein [Spirochaetia bacterium]
DAKRHFLSYLNPEETEKVLKDGWLNTGDIVMLTYNDEIKIIGRAKDTIVLLGGENVEPEPIEDKLCQSDYIEQAMVVGQDQRFLGALIVPNLETLEEYAQSKGISYIEREELINNPEILELINDEIQGLVSTKTGFKPFERIFRFKILEKKFEVGVEMTHSLKIRRNVVSEMYAKQIKQLFV